MIQRNTILKLRLVSGIAFGLGLSLFLNVSLAFAQAAAETPPQPSFGEMLNRMLPMFLMVFFIFYFLVLRPQNQKLKQHQALLGSLKKGDQVVSTGGIIGRVAGIEKDHILLEVSNNVRLKIENAHITRKFEKASEEKSAA